MKNNKVPLDIFSRRIGMLFLIFLVFGKAHSQVKIGDNPNTIDPASVLELESTSRVLVITSVTDAQMQLIEPLQGAIVYNIDQQCVFYFDSNDWKNLCIEGGGSGGNGATLVDNGDNTYTFTDTNGVETLITFEGGGNSVTGQPGSIFFAGTNSNASENNDELFWDTITNRMGIGTNANLNNKFTVNGDIGSTQLLLNNANQEATPLIIRGSGSDQKMVAFQDENLGTTLFNINFRGAGLNIDEVNKQHRLFIKILGGVGIETAQPTETLDVAGTLRIRELTPAQTTDNFVTVDANGVFHRSTTQSTSGKSLGPGIDKPAARWFNKESTSLKEGNSVLPIFAIEDFKDDGKTIYQAKDHSLIVQEAGRFEIKSNISLIGSNLTSTGKIVSTFARVHVNGVPKGAISVAANNGSRGDKVQSSIHIVELLKLDANDRITIVVSTDAQSGTLNFNEQGTSNISIIKMK